MNAAHRRNFTAHPPFLTNIVGEHLSFYLFFYYVKTKNFITETLLILGYSHHHFTHYLLLTCSINRTGVSPMSLLRRSTYLFSLTQSPWWLPYSSLLVQYEIKICAVQRKRKLSAMATFKVFLIAILFVQFCSSKIWKDVGKTLRFVGDSPQNDDHKDVFTIDARDALIEGPNAWVESARMAFNEARKRAKRSTDDLPKTNFVSMSMKCQFNAVNSM